jgi:hypothetical protein
MTDRSLTDKTFSKESDTLAAETGALIRKIKKHIEENDCKCCKEALR